MGLVHLHMPTKQQQNKNKLQRSTSGLTAVLSATATTLHDLLRRAGACAGEGCPEKPRARTWNLPGCMRSASSFWASIGNTEISSVHDAQKARAHPELAGVHAERVELLGLNGGAVHAVLAVQELHHRPVAGAHRPVVPARAQNP